MEYVGALMINDLLALAVEPDQIVFDRFSDDRTKPGQSGGRAGLGARGEDAQMRRSPTAIALELAGWVHAAGATAQEPDPPAAVQLRRA